MTGNKLSFKFYKLILINFHKINRIEGEIRGPADWEEFCNGYPG